MNQQQFRRGDIWFYRPSAEQPGSIQSGPRPVIIVSNSSCNLYSPVLLAIPLTSQPKKNLPTHVVFTIDGIFNTALVEQAGPVKAADLVNFKWRLEPHLMEQIDKALLLAFGLTLGKYDKEGDLK